MNNPLVQPDPGLYIWTIVTFLVLVAALAKFAWRPLLDGPRAPAGADPQVARRCAEGKAGAGAAQRRVAAHPRGGAHRGRTDPLAYTLGRQPVSRGDEAEGAGRSRRHRQERREADRARDRARASADPARRPSTSRWRSPPSCCSATCRRKTTSGSSKTRSSRSKNVVPINQRPESNSQFPDSSMFGSWILGVGI